MMFCFSNPEEHCLVLRKSLFSHPITEACIHPEPLYYSESGQNIQVRLSTKLHHRTNALSDTHESLKSCDSVFRNGIETS